MLIVIGVAIAVGVGVTTLVGTSIRDFTRDIPEYGARINAKVLPVLEWLSAKGMSVPTSDLVVNVGSSAASSSPASWDAASGCRRWWCSSRSCSGDGCSVR